MLLDMWEHDLKMFPSLTEFPFLWSLLPADTAEFCLSSFVCLVQINYHKIIEWILVGSRSGLTFASIMYQLALSPHLEEGQ